MTQPTPYYVLAYYLFVPISNPQEEVAAHLEFFNGRDAASRIYISEDGINGQMSAIQEDAEAYIEWMHARPLFKDIHFKIHLHHENVFPRLTIKYRRQLVAVDQKVDLELGGDHLSPDEWQRMLAKKEERVLLDVRNDYEWQVGRFEGAALPPCKTFREFSAYADELKETTDPVRTPVMMYCTGGIRCELYSAILKEKGFEKVYQLEGGIINYGLKQGSTHWLGKLFVFDDRLAIPISEEEAPVIGTCHHCGAANDNYYNCANMDCNELFLCCKSCLDHHVGCCQPACQTAPRLRPYNQQNPHKPFRRQHLLK